MIKIPYEDIITKIKEEAGLSNEEIELKIKEKLKQLSGLISEEGAAHILANELGIKLFEAVSGRLQIKNILAGMRDVEILGKATQIFSATEFQRQDGSKGKVGSLMLADETGAIRITLWGSQADKLSAIQQGTTIKIVGGYVKENNSRKEVHLNDRSKLIINPEGETVEIKTPVQQRKKINELKQGEENITLLGTIVQLSDLRFYEICPQCQKRARLKEDTFYCEEHDKIQPDFSYVLNIILDDGSETIRAVFFRKQAEQLLNLTKEQILQFRQSPEKFDEIKTNLLGNITKITGRVNKNELFNRLEFISQQVFPNPDPEEEMRYLEQEAKKE